MPLSYVISSNAASFSLQTSLGLQHGVQTYCYLRQIQHCCLLNTPFPQAPQLSSAPSCDRTQAPGWSRKVWSRKDGVERMSLHNALEAFGSG